MPDVNFIFFGVRGSYPVPDCRVTQYGGNTASLLVEKGDKIVVFDAGTGIINIGNYLNTQKPHVRSLDIFLTHFHIDHIQGLPFFEPCFSSDFMIRIYGCPYDNMAFKDIILSLFNQPYSPISSKGIKAKLHFVELYPDKPQPLSLGDGLEVGFHKENSHPLSGVLIYRLGDGQKSLVYATDVESPQGFSGQTLDFVRGADVLIHDSQYFDAHYDSPGNSRRGFGHSTVSMAVNNARHSKAGKLFLFHYDPAYSDADVKRLLKEARKTFKNTFLAEETKKFVL